MFWTHADKQARVPDFVGKHIGKLDAGSGGLFLALGANLHGAIVVLVFFLLSEARD
jgi:hypothetical protein